MTMKRSPLTPEEIAAAREWLADCVWPDCEPEEFATMDEQLIVRGVARHFDGGIEGFKQTCMPA